MNNEQNNQDPQKSHQKLDEPPKGLFSQQKPISETQPDGRALNYSLEAEQRASSFLWNVHQYLNQYIQFADTKAAVCFATTSGILIWLLTKANELSQLASKSTFTAWLLYIGIAVLIISCIFAISVFLPRLWSGSKRGFIYWGEIAAFKNSEEYLAALHSKNFVLNDSIGAHVYILSAVVKAKYRDVTVAMVLAVLAVLILIRPIWLVSSS